MMSKGDKYIDVGFRIIMSTILATFVGITFAAFSFHPVLGGLALGVTVGFGLVFYGVTR